MYQGFSRRKFIGRLAGAAVMLGGGPAVLGARAQSPDSEVSQQQLAQARDLLGDNPSLDLHCHPGLFVLKDIPNSVNVRTYFGDDAVAARIRQMLDGRMWGASMAFVIDAPVLRPTPKGPRPARDFAPGEAWTEYKRQYRVLNDLLADLPAVRVLTADDLMAAHAQGRVGALYACEGADHLEARPDLVEQLHGDGIRQVQIVHYRDNEFGDVRRRSDQLERGLTAKGRDLVKELNRLGIIVDVSHSTEALTISAAEASSAPIVSSHALLPIPGGQGMRTTRAQALAVARTGGVIGAFPGAGNRNLAGFVDSIFRLIDRVGIDHVGLGTDMDGNIRPVWDDYAELPRLTAMLLARGLSAAETAKLVGGNAVRVWKAVTR